MIRVETYEALMSRPKRIVFAIYGALILFFGLIFRPSYKQVVMNEAYKNHNAGYKFFWIWRDSKGQPYGVEWEGVLVNVLVLLILCGFTLLIVRNKEHQEKRNESE